VADRPGHDQRYAVDSAKAEAELDWKPLVSFRQGLAETIDWYRAHSGWLDRIRSGAYLKYYETQYGKRLESSSDT
jgi:dTDP-glucose 4,6-dehydratase